MCRTYRRALVLTVIAMCCPAGPAVPAEEIRDRAGLIKFLTRPIADTLRNRRCLELINRELDDNYLGIDAEWFHMGGGGYIARTQTNLLGQLAFYYRTKGLKYHRDPKVLETIRRAFEGVVKHVSDEGKFTWTTKLNAYGYDSEVHEHGWRLEPLVLALIWMGEDLPEKDRAAIEAALLRAATWLATHPMPQHNNRGAVWCATTTLAGVYFNKKEFLDTVEKHAPVIISSVVLDDGECGEHTAQYGGGGPDANYSYTGWSYVYLYRVLSAKTELDGRMQQSLRWFATYNTRSACPLVSGASVRRRQVNPPNLQDLLPALERYSHIDPFFAAVADRVVTKKEKFLKGIGGHLVSPLIWALLEQGVEAPAQDPPDWYRNVTALYARREVHYALVSRQYQTGVTLRGRTRKGYDFALRGMQSFAFGDEYPILLHTDTQNSSTQADGIDTATTNVEKGPNGWEVLLSKGAVVGGAKAELATIASRVKTLWTLYGCTPTSAVVVFGGAKGELTTRWVMNRSFVPQPLLDAAKGRIGFEGRKGTIHFLQGQVTLGDVPGQPKAEGNLPDDPATVLELVTPAPIQVFAFSNGSFRFGKHDTAKEELTFEDESGRYRLSLKAVLGADGNLDRAGPIRLQTSGD